MGVRKYKNKPASELSRNRGPASQPTAKRPWLTGEQNLAYFTQPYHLRPKYSGRTPLSSLPDSYIDRYYLKPLKLYQEQPKEAQEYSTA